MEILRELDEKATRARVKNFLNDEFKQILSTSSKSAADLQSPTISDMPSSPNYGNANEAKIINSVDADIAIDEVIEAINSIGDEDSVQLLKFRFLLMLDWNLISDRLGMAETTMYRKFDKACIHFARSYKRVNLCIYKDKVGVNRE